MPETRVARHHRTIQTALPWVPSRPQSRGSAELAGTEYSDGWGAHCYQPAAKGADNDKSFGAWTCAEGLACQVAGKFSRMGMCFVKSR